MRTLYDVQQLLKKFGIYVYVGKRKYDIELMGIELKNIYDASLITQKEFDQASLILKREHELEELLEDGGKG